MPGMIDKYFASEDKKSLKQIADVFKKTELDGSFQRWGGFDYGSGWTTKQGILYLENLVEGGTFNFILVVELRYAVEWADKKNDKKSSEYFNELIKRGFEYLSIDGNNSSSFITEFVDDNEEVTIKGKRISEYSEEEQEDLKFTEKVKFIVLRHISADECATLFRNLNSSTHLNGQEHRQARLTDLSKFIRETANQQATREMFLGLVYSNEDNLDKRSHEEMVAQFCLKHEKKFDIDLKATQLNSFYEDNNDISQETKDIANHVLEESSRCQKAASLKGGKHMKKGPLQNLWDVIFYVDQLDMVIADHEKFISWYFEKDAYYNVQAGNIPEKEQEEKSYTYWTKFYNTGTCYRMLGSLWSDRLDTERKELIQKGILCDKPPQRATTDRFSLQEKLKLWIYQGGKDRNGDMIPILGIYNGKYEADHVKSVASGGETAISNGELMTKEENRKKGSDNNEPHFDFQKQEEVLRDPVAQ